MVIARSDTGYPSLTRKWKKYYRVEEVDWHLYQLTEENEKGRKKYEALSSMYDALLQEEDTWHKRISELEEQVANQTKVISDKNMEIEELKNQLEKSRSEASLQAEELKNQLAKSRSEASLQSEDLAQQALEIEMLQVRVEKLNEMVAKLKAQNPDDLLLEAENKAQQIVSKAIADSEKMLQQVNEQRTRVVAASRVAYYNALQFKQELAERFGQMEQDLDSAIDLLRTMENSKLSMLQVSDLPLIVEERAT